MTANKYEAREQAIIAGDRDKLGGSSAPQQSDSGLQQILRKPACLGGGAAKRDDRQEFGIAFLRHGLRKGRRDQRGWHARPIREWGVVIPFITAPHRTGGRQYREFALIVGQSALKTDGDADLLDRRRQCGRIEHRQEWLWDASARSVRDQLIYLPLLRTGAGQCSVQSDRMLIQP